MRKRRSAPKKNTAPIAAVVVNSSHTMSNPAPRYRMAWAKLTKCVDGEPCMTVCKSLGIAVEATGEFVVVDAVFNVVLRVDARSGDRAMISR